MMRTVSFFDHQALRTIRYWLGWILRPRLAYLRIREAKHASGALPVRSNLKLSALPTVTLRIAKTPRDIELVVDLYRRNPSNMTISPRSVDAVEKKIAGNTEFYCIFDVKGEHVGNLAFQVNRSMLGHITIEYAHRGGGLGLAAELAVSKLLVQRGIDIVYAQVYYKNRRALTHLLNLGYEMDEKESTEKYLTLKKDLSAVLVERP